MAVTLKYAKITGRVGIMVADTTGDPDTNPDIVYADQGMCVLEPQLTRVQVNGNVLGPIAVNCPIDANGNITLNGVSEVYVLDLGDPNLPTFIDRSKGAWKVSFTGVKAGGQTIQLDPFFCNPNADDNDIIDTGETVQRNDLSRLMPMPVAGQAQSIVRGPAGPAGADGLIQSIVAGTTNVAVDATDPANPVISVSGTGGTPGGTGDQLLSTDTQAEAWTVLGEMPATNLPVPGDMWNALGDVPTANLPALAISDYFPAGNQAERLGLDAQRGDWTVQADTGVTYILAADDPTVDPNWVPVSVPAAVQSVAGKTGVVVLVKGDVGLDQVDNTSDANKPVSTAQQAQLDAKADLSGGHIPVSQGTVGITLTVLSTTSWPARPTSDSTNVHIRWVDAGGLGTSPAGALDGDSLIAAS